MLLQKTKLDILILFICRRGLNGPIKGTRTVRADTASTSKYNIFSYFGSDDEINERDSNSNSLDWINYL